MSQQPEKETAKQDVKQDATQDARQDTTQDARQDTKQEQKPEKKRPRPTDPIDYLDQLDIKLDGLKPIQNAAVVILLGGCTISETAGMVGVHRNTIHRWIKNVPEFRKGLRGAQNEQREAVLAQLDAMGRKAAGAVEQAIDKGDPRIALQLLKGIGLLGDQTATRNPYFKRQAERSNKKKPDWGRKWQLPGLPRFGRSEVMASSILLLLASLLVVGILNLVRVEPPYIGRDGVYAREKRRNHHYTYISSAQIQAARTVEKPEVSVPANGVRPCGTTACLKTGFREGEAPAEPLVSASSAQQELRPPSFKTRSKKQARPLSDFTRAAQSNTQKSSVAAVVRNPVPPVVNQTTTTIATHLAELENGAELDNWLISAELQQPRVQHSATLCTHCTPRLHRGGIPDG